MRPKRADTWKARYRAYAAWCRARGFEPPYYGDWLASKPMAGTFDSGLEFEADELSAEDVYRLSRER